MQRGSLFRWCWSLCLWLAVLPLEAAVYQWTDEQGRVHYSDRPVHESATEIDVRTKSPEKQTGNLTEERKVRRQRMLDAYEQERAEKREAKAKVKQEREERKRACHRARAEYDEYSTAGSIYNYLENGERRYLDKEEREQYLASLKAKVERYCD